jgi:KaiC/GvpD/RAD55 family RecA-like ATPase
MERTPTGITGLDQMLGGGIPTGYTVLLSGGPGSGKSTFAMQFLTNGKEQYGEDGVYITMDERPAEIDRNFSQYGWDLSKIKLLGLNIRQATDTTEVKYTTLDEEKREQSNIIELDVKKISVESLKDFITKIVEQTKAKRLVVDSLASFSLQLQTEYEVRQEVLALVNLLHDLGCTTLLLTEKPEGSEGISRFGVEEFMCQGVMVLYNLKVGSKRSRGLEVFKMRGTNHSQKICMMMFGEHGVEVYPDTDMQMD